MMIEAPLALISAIAATIAAFSGIFVVLLARRTAFQAERARLSMEREYAESKIADLYQRLQHSEERFNELNRLLLESIEKPTETPSELAGSALEIAKRSKFLKRLGVDAGRLSVEPRRVFFLTPFSVRQGREFEVVKSVCHRRNLSVRRGDEVYVSGNLLRHLLEEIIVSNLVIVNINGRNPNVFYELGIAQMLEKRIIMIADAGEKLTFDLAQQQIVLYRTDDELEKGLDVAISNAFVDFQ